MFADKKTDKILLMDVNRGKEITEGFIEANTRVIVVRLPLTKSDPVELVYNPKLTGENTLGQNKKGQDGLKKADGNLQAEKGEEGGP